jgi:hypothetical protein
MGEPIGPNADPFQAKAGQFDSDVQPSAAKVPDFNYNLGSVNPMTDLSYNTFARGYGMNKSNAEAQARYGRESLNAQLQGAMQGFNTQRKEGVTDANESATLNGGVSSSANLLSQDRVVRDVNTKEAAFRQGIADQQAQLAFGLQNTLTGLDTQRAEAEMQARQNLLAQQNQAVAYQQAAAALGLDPSLASLLQAGYNG